VFSDTSVAVCSAPPANLGTMLVLSGTQLMHWIEVLGTLPKQCGFVWGSMDHTIKPSRARLSLRRKWCSEYLHQRPETSLLPPQKSTALLAQHKT
jgi:hypothetical protein